MAAATSDYVILLKEWVRTKPTNLLGWLRLDQLPWSSAFSYQIIERFPEEIETVVVNLTGVTRGVRLISQRSLDAWLVRLAQEQREHPEIMAERSRQLSATRRAGREKTKAKEDVFQMGF